jgi:HEAT repeat protein
MTARSIDGLTVRLALLTAFCCLSTASGCADALTDMKSFVTKPFREKSPEEALNIKTPDDRVKELHALTKSAIKKSPEEQERISRELAAEIKEEHDPLMRRQLLRTLEPYPTQLALAVLVAGTKDTEVEVRRVACECLGRRRGVDAVRELSRVANSDTDFDVRVAAVRALGETGDQAAMPALADAVADNDPALQYRAAQSLRAISGRDYGDNMEAWHEFAKTGKSATPEIGIAERAKRMFY